MIATRTLETSLILSKLAFTRTYIYIYMLYTCIIHIYVIYGMVPSGAWVLICYLLFCKLLKGWILLVLGGLSCMVIQICIYIYIYIYCNLYTFIVQLLAQKSCEDKCLLEALVLA